MTPRDKKNIFQERSGHPANKAETSTKTRTKK